jgi:hypothetical protein
LKNYYDLLGVHPTAPLQDIKQAFRVQIARYHPDKVQHLGQEFQDMAVGRAAELTEAYRALSHEGRRAEYDAARILTGVDPPRAASVPVTSSTEPASGPSPGPAAVGDDPALERPAASQFAHDRASRDTLVRNAILDRFRLALAQVAGTGYAESPARGFDISCVPRSKFFARAKGPRLLGHFVARVDGAAVGDAWARVGTLNLPAGEEVCVILMGTQVAPPRELAAAIAAERRRRARGARVTLIPVNASIWDAHMPIDAPEVAKELLNKLRAGS